MLGDDAADRGDVRGVERGEAGVAPEDAEDADPLVRADRGALPLDRVDGAGDRGREADAVLGVADVVVHRLRDRDHLRAEVVQPRRVGEGVVAADGEEVVEPRALEVREHRARDVVDGAGHAPLRRSAPSGSPRPCEVRRELLHLGRVRAARVEERAAGPVDGARVVARERQHVPRAARGIVEIEVREPLPPAADADRPRRRGRRPVDDALDDGVQAGDVAPAREDPDARSCHARNPRRTSRDTPLKNRPSAPLWRPPACRAGERRTAAHAHAAGTTYHWPFAPCSGLRSPSFSIASSMR